jgi:hypothetical protein
MHPQLQHSPDFNTGRSSGVNEGGDDDDDLARSEAERGQLKDIVLKFHRNRHALLSPPQDDDDFTPLPPVGLSAATPNRNTAPSPYPYQRDELLGSGGVGVGIGGLAGDITMSPTPREAPKVCLSPYKRATLVYSGQHIHSSVSTSSSSSSSSTPSGSSSAVPTRKSLFNSGDALGTLGVSSSSGVPSRHGHGIELGLLPSSSSPPLPMQREIVDKVKVALDEAVQSVKSRIIEVYLAPTLCCVCACACGAVRVIARSCRVRHSVMRLTFCLDCNARNNCSTGPSHHSPTRDETTTPPCTITSDQRSPVPVLSSHLLP